jgi:hypothetical protein
LPSRRRLSADGEVRSSIDIRPPLRSPARPAAGLADSREPPAGDRRFPGRNGKTTLVGPTGLAMLLPERRRQCVGGWLARIGTTWSSGQLICAWSSSHGCNSHLLLLLPPSILRRISPGPSGRAREPGEAAICASSRVRRNEIKRKRENKPPPRSTCDGIIFLSCDNSQRFH